MPSEGLRLRCARCEAVFRVRAPSAAPAPVAQPGPATGRAPAPPPGQAGEPATAARPAAMAAPAGADAERRRQVLVADPDPERAKATAEALGAMGLVAMCAHDGVEAILTLQRTLPRAAVLDAALPRMYGFQICELVKRNESLRSTWIVLVGAGQDAPRHQRPPSELYGADATVDRADLPHALGAVLRGFGLPVHEPAAASAPRPAPPEARPAPQAAPSRPAPAAAASTAPAAPASAPAAPGGDHAQAERLARIIVSDIVLYNPDQFSAALASGDVVAALADQVEEGRALLRQRLGEQVARERDFVGDELRRVARQRGGA